MAVVAVLASPKEEVPTKLKADFPGPRLPWKLPPILQYRAEVLRAQNWEEFMSKDLADKKVKNLSQVDESPSEQS